MNIGSHHSYTSKNIQSMRPGEYHTILGWKFFPSQSSGPYKTHTLLFLVFLVPTFYCNSEFLLGLYYNFVFLFCYVAEITMTARWLPATILLAVLCVHVSIPMSFIFFYRKSTIYSYFYGRRATYPQG